MPKEFKNRWVEPGDEKVTNIPTIASTRQYHNDSQLSYAYNAYNYSTARVAKGDFIRLKDISLTYEFSKTLISHLGLSTLSLKAMPPTSSSSMPTINSTVRIRSTSMQVVWPARRLSSLPLPSVWVSK